MPKANQADGDADDEPIIDPTVGEVAEGEENPAPQAEPVVEPAEDETVVTIDGESPTPEDNTAPEWVRSLRKNYRELQREKRELEARLKAQEVVEKPPAILGKKPTLEECDYDADKFEQELASWFDRKKAIDDEAAKLHEAQAAQQRAWQSKLDSYGKAKSELKVSDYDSAESTVQETLNITQQGIILQGAQNPALLIYALGKNPKKATELAELKDPVQFAFAMGKLETQLKISSRKSTPPPPEKKVIGNASGSTSDDTLERLRDEASRTGDFTKVVAYKRQLKNQSS